MVGETRFLMQDPPAPTPWIPSLATRRSRESSGRKQATYLSRRRTSTALTPEHLMPVPPWQLVRVACARSWLGSVCITIRLLNSTLKYIAVKE